MELKLRETVFYRVKKGQSVEKIGVAFHIPPRVLAVCNGLKEQPHEGAVLQIPAEKHNLYTVRGGESMTLLCGSEENFAALNCTRLFYPGQIIWL